MKPNLRLLKYDRPSNTITMKGPTRWERLCWAVRHLLTRVFICWRFGHAQAYRTIQYFYYETGDVFIICPDCRVTLKRMVRGSVSSLSGLDCHD